MKKILLALGAVCCLLPMLLGMGFCARGQEDTLQPKAVLASVKAGKSTHKVTVNGTAVSPQAYNINGYNYFKLRDIAFLLRDTEDQFDLEWNAKTTTINMLTETYYEAVGGEMKTDSATNVKVSASTAKVTLDGKAASVGGYNINGNNYYKIADLAKTVGFTVSYDEKTSTVKIVSAVSTKDPEDQDKAKDETPEEVPPPPPRTSHLDGVLTIMIDAGHGGKDAGASNKEYELDEKHINLYVAQYLQEMLEDAGVKVIMVRNTLEEGGEITLRGDLMTQYKDSLDLFFSVHHNAANTTAKGAQVLAQVQDKDGGPTKDLADELAKEFAKVGLTLRNTWFREGDKGDYYYTNRVAASLQIPAVISEYCFIDNEEDVQFVLDEEGWKREAQAQFNAIMNYYKTAEY